jgi:hypothetical protein
VVHIDLDRAHTVLSPDEARGFAAELKRIADAINPLSCRRRGSARFGQRDRKTFDIWMACYTQEEVAALSTGVFKFPIIRARFPLLASTCLEITSFNSNVLNEVQHESNQFGVLSLQESHAWWVPTGGTMSHVG